MGNLLPLMVFNMVTILVRVILRPMNSLSKQKLRMILLKSNAIAKQIMLQYIQDLKSIDAPCTVKIASVQLIPML